MELIVFDSKKHTYNKVSKTFQVNEKDTTFATEYSIKNPKSGASVVFKLSHSTGCEWDPNTKWIYKSDCGLVLEISQDLEITKKREAAYINHKLKN